MNIQFVFHTQQQSFIGLFTAFHLISLGVYYLDIFLISEKGHVLNKKRKHGKNSKSWKLKDANKKPKQDSWI